MTKLLTPYGYDPEISAAVAAYRKVVELSDECPTCHGATGWLVDVTGRHDYQPGDETTEWDDCPTCSGRGRVAQESDK